MITFLFEIDLWWPDYDHRPEKNCAFIRERVGSTDLAISLTQHRRVAVQAGGHAGIWALHLARHFDQVHTFEPQPALSLALQHNTAAHPGILVHRTALSEQAGSLRMREHHNPAAWRIDPDGQSEVEAVALDDLDLPACDALFLDIEGHEPQALRGAEATIRRFRPVIQIEELPRSRDAIREILAGLGYVVRAGVRNDTVYVPA